LTNRTVLGPPPSERSKAGPTCTGAVQVAPPSRVPATEYSQLPLVTEVQLERRSQPVEKSVMSRSTSASKELLGGGAGIGFGAGVAGSGEIEGRCVGDGEAAGNATAIGCSARTMPAYATLPIASVARTVIATLAANPESPGGHLISIKTPQAGLWLRCETGLSRRACGRELQTGRARGLCRPARARRAPARHSTPQTTCLPLSCFS